MRGREAARILEEGGKVETGWRSLERVIGLLNAIVAGYQLCMVRMLGSGATATTQILLTEVGELLSRMVDRILDSSQASYELENVGKLIANAFRELGIARRVEVEELEATEKHGQKLRRYRVLVYDSIFSPAHRILVERGVREFTLSPEALLAAAIVRRVLRERTGGDRRARVTVKAILPQAADQPLEVLVEQLVSL